MLSNVTKSFLKSHLNFWDPSIWQNVFYLLVQGSELWTLENLSWNCKGSRIQAWFQPTSQWLGVDSLHEYISHTRHTKTIFFCNIHLNLSISNHDSFLTNLTCPLVEGVLITDFTDKNSFVQYLNVRRFMIYYISATFWWHTDILPEWILKERALSNFFIQCC